MTPEELRHEIELGNRLAAEDDAMDQAEADNHATPSSGPSSSLSVEHKRHRCMRCNEEYDCPVPDTCQANYDVLPVTQVGFVHQCPITPTWDWIRAYGQRRFDNGRAESQQEIETLKAENAQLKEPRVCQSPDDCPCDDGEPNPCPKCGARA